MSHSLKTLLFSLVLAFLVLSPADGRACSTHLQPVPLRYLKDEPQWLVKKHESLYENLSKHLEQNPGQFEKHHHLLFQILTNPSALDHTVQEWQSHEYRFDLWHPHLWGVLDGYVHMPAVITPASTVSDGLGGLPGLKPGSKGIDGGSGGGNPGKPAGDPGTGPGGGGIPQGAVPEPPAMVLMLSGMILAGLGAARKVVWDHALRAVQARRGRS